MTGSDKPAEPVGLNMSLDAIIAKRGTNAGGGRGAGRGRGGEGLAVKGGVSKPESGRGAGSFNRDQQSGGGRGQGSQRGGISGGRGGGRFAGSDGGRGRGGRGGPGMGAMPMQQQQRAPMQHFAAPGHGMGGNPANALEARLLEQARIIEMQQRQTMMLQAQLIQQQQEMAAAAAAVAQGGAWRGMQGAGTSAPASAVGVAAAAPGGRALRQLTGRAPAVVEEPAPAPQMPDEDPPEGVECFLEEDTGNVVVMLQDSPIVTATPTGELLLSTGGWYTDETGVQGRGRVEEVLGHTIAAVRMSTSQHPARNAGRG